MSTDASVSPSSQLCGATFGASCAVEVAATQTTSVGGGRGNRQDQGAETGDTPAVAAS